jgi:hypothetical protein
MTIEEFKSGAINHGVDALGKIFARLRLDEAEKSTANSDLTRSPLAPAVDPSPRGRLPNAEGRRVPSSAALTSIRRRIGIQL